MHTGKGIKELQIWETNSYLEISITLATSKTGGDIKLGLLAVLEACSKTLLLDVQCRLTQLLCCDTQVRRWGGGCQNYYLIGHLIIIVVVMMALNSFLPGFAAFPRIVKSMLNPERWNFTTDPPQMMRAYYLPETECWWMSDNLKPKPLERDEEKLLRRWRGREGERERGGRNLAWKGEAESRITKHRDWCLCHGLR